jgi:MoxR-like ATPase
MSKFKTRYTYKRKRTTNPDGTVSYQKQREYSNQPRPTVTTVTAVTQTPSAEQKTNRVANQTVKSKGTVTFGGITLAIQAEPSDPTLVPPSQYLVGQEELLEAIGVGVAKNMPVLLKGETGTGKTTLVKELANRTNNVLRQINLNGNTTVDELVGKMTLNSTGTEFRYGILIKAMQNGDWLLLDELNAGHPEVLLALQEVLITGRITLAENEGEVVTAHPNFRVFGTMNPPETYIGTNFLNLATLSRFTMTIEVGYPDPKVELDIIKSKLPSKARTTDSEMSECIRLATDIRNGYAQQEYAYLLSTRDLIGWLSVNEHFGDLVKSAEYTILGKCNQDDRQALSSILKVYFSASGDVSVADGQMNMMYKKGNLFQVCDDNLEVSDPRTYNRLGKVEKGGIIEVLQIKNGTILGRLMKGKVVDPQGQDLETPITHRDTLKIGDLSAVSTRRVGA